MSEDPSSCDSIKKTENQENNLSPGKEKSERSHVHHFKSIIGTKLPVKATALEDMKIIEKELFLTSKSAKLKSYNISLTEDWKKLLEKYNINIVSHSA